MLLFWLLLGALIGAYAAQKKGFSTVGGVIGGMLLGPLAFLMFFMTGIFSSKEQQRKCPFCAEWVKPEAVVCKHCSRDLPPPIPEEGLANVASVMPGHGMSIITKAVIGIGAAFVALLLFGALVVGGGSSSPSDDGVFSLLSPVTMAEFNRLQTGMTYSQAQQVIGSAGEEISRSELVGTVTVMYAWKNADGSNMNAMFQDGGLITKAQFGLR
jgi:uncharacterized membrane protein YeaQ/YmgE (transglycosylase-associated protein family)